MKSAFVTLVAIVAVQAAEPDWVYIENEKLRLDANGIGVGIFVPLADEVTSYRFGDGTHRSHCSYIAALTPGKAFEYHARFTQGTEEQIRARFAALKQAPTSASGPAK